MAAPMSHGVRIRLPPRSLASVATGGGPEAPPPPDASGRGAGARVTSRATGARTVLVGSAPATAAAPTASPSVPSDVEAALGFRPSDRGDDRGARRARGTGRA